MSRPRRDRQRKHKLARREAQRKIRERLAPFPSWLTDFREVERVLRKYCIGDLVHMGHMYKNGRIKPSLRRHSVEFFRVRRCYALDPIFTLANHGLIPRGRRVYFAPLHPIMGFKYNMQVYKEDAAILNDLLSVRAELLMKRLEADITRRNLLPNKGIQQDAGQQQQGSTSASEEGCQNSSREA